MLIHQSGTRLGLRLADQNKPVFSPFVQYMLMTWILWVGCKKTKND